MKKAFKCETAEKFFNSEILVNWLDIQYSQNEDYSRKIWTVYVFIVWYDIYFNENDKKVKKPQNHLVELKAKAEAKRKLARQKAAIAKVQAELAQQEGIHDDGYADNSSDTVEDAFDDESLLATKFQGLQDNILGLNIPEEDQTPLEQAEQAVMLESFEDEGFEDAIEENGYEDEEEVVEEYIDITKQAEITDDDGIIRDDVIDNIIFGIDDLKDSE